jgi:hypothetical protein
MLAVAVLLGLAVGGAFGFSDRKAGANSPTGQQSSGAGETTTSSEPETFWTVVMASPTSEEQRDRDEAAVRAKGVQDVFVASPDRYTPIGTAFAICTGHFDTEEQAAVYAKQIKPLKVAGNPFPKKLTSLQAG